ncbi:P-loop containing nucleoside triphosphate hydrolase protein, partial [Tribonema minus]
MLWLDKHRPNSLNKLDVHPDLTERLKIMSKDGEIPHLLFYGPSGAGKRTRILALLKEIFGPGAERVHLEHRTFKTPSNRTIELTTVASNYHIEMSPGDAGTYDRFVVQEVIKEIAGSTSLTATMGGNAAAAARAAEDGGGGGAGGARRKPTFKVVLLTGVDSLTKQAQAALRRTMEKYTSSCRLILCCNSISKVIDPVRSRCLSVRVPAPSEPEITGVLGAVARKEGVALPAELAARISRASGRNLRRALLMLEACKVEQSPLLANQRVALADWETYIESLAKDITQEQSPQALVAARGKLYELLVNCIPADVVLRRLARELIALMADDALKHEVAHWAAFYDTRLRQSAKEVFQLEAFVAKFMMLYKAFIVSMFA